MLLGGQKLNIGIFDSGIGGMTLLHQALVSLPNEDYIFYADTDNVPYGTKTRKQVISYVDTVMAFMEAHHCDAVVIACNTATAVAAAPMREKYSFPIIGIEPAVKPAVNSSNGKRVLVIATPLTVKEEKLRNLVEKVDNEHLVDLLALPRLVEFAERGEFDSPSVVSYLENELSRYDFEEYGELVLGCTHFNYFKDSLRRILPNPVKLIDGSEGTINQLARVLKLETLKEQTFTNDLNVEYYYSGRRLTEGKDLLYMKELHFRLERMRDVI
jgi:glutamate racemase